MGRSFRSYEWGFNIFRIHLSPPISRDILFEGCPQAGVVIRGLHYISSNGNFVFRVCSSLGPNIVLGRGRYYEPVLDCSPGR